MNPKSLKSKNRFSKWIRRVFYLFKYLNALLLLCIYMNLSEYSKKSNQSTKLLDHLRLHNIDESVSTYFDLFEDIYFEFFEYSKILRKSKLSSFQKYIKAVYVLLKQKSMIHRHCIEEVYFWAKEDFDLKLGTYQKTISNFLKNADYDDRIEQIESRDYVPKELSFEEVERILKFAETNLEELETSAFEEFKYKVPERVQRTVKKQYIMELVQAEFKVDEKDLFNSTVLQQSEKLQRRLEQLFYAFSQ